MPVQQGESVKGRVSVASESVKQTGGEMVRSVSEDKFHLLFEMSPVGMVLHEMDGKLVQANQAYFNIIGYSFEEAVKLSYWEITPRKYEELEKEQVQLMQWTGRFGPYEKEYRHKSGRLVPVLINGFVVTGIDGLRRIWSIIEDITLHKRSEELLREREEQLLQLQKMDALGRLAGGVAHDFNNLLTVILGYSDMLLKHSAKDDFGNFPSAEIMDAAKRASALTRQLLTFSRKQVIQPEILDLNASIADAEKMLSRLIGEDIQLVRRSDPNLSLIRADPFQIQQVLMNLAINARDAMMPHGGTLTLETFNLEMKQEMLEEYAGVSPGSYAAVRVQDTGCGMSPEVQAHIFEPFFSTKGPEQGTGLGLATVYGIVKQSGGYILVRSEVGKGSSFTVLMPQASRERVFSGGSPEIQKSFGGTEKVFLVEDEDKVRAFIRRVLESEGYTVVEARNGVDALEVYRILQSPIHLLISDVVMPNMKGPELVQKLRPMCPNLKVILMSGYTGERLTAQDLSENGTIFLQKPFMPDVLLRKMRELLDSPC